MYFLNPQQYTTPPQQQYIQPTQPPASSPAQQPVAQPTPSPTGQHSPKLYGLFTCSVVFMAQMLNPATLNFFLAGQAYSHGSHIHPESTVSCIQRSMCRL